MVDKPELEPEPEVDEPDLESKVKDPFIGTHVDLPAQPTMKLSSSVMRGLLSRRSPDVYDHLQIFLEATSSQGIGFPMMQSTIDPVFSKMICLETLDMLHVSFSSTIDHSR